MTSGELDRILELTARLSPSERLRLVERIAHDLAEGAADERGRPSWSDLAGAGPALLGGEDAQAWISRSRGDSDRRSGGPGPDDA